MNIQKARTLLYEAGLKLIKEGLVARTWGNISLRLNEESFLITPSGRTYEALSLEEMVVVKIADLTHQGEIKPSSEKGMHAEVYKMRPEITAVVHTHQLQASTVAAARCEVTGLTQEEQHILGTSVRCSAYALPGTKKLKQTATQALGEKRQAALLANHGALCIGTTMEKAFEVAKTLETACQAFILRSFSKKHAEISLPKNLNEATMAMHQYYLEKAKGGAV